MNSYLSLDKISNIDRGFEFFMVGRSHIYAHQSTDRIFLINR
jgi:hypothetical protein